MGASTLQENTVAASPLAIDPYDGPVADRPASAVSWAAILAGAAATAALSLILLVLGTGLGLTSLSPYAGSGVSAMALGLSAIVWVMVTQALASGMGGYLAGRLRSRWVATHSDEVYFRDTAHGFLSWAIASLVTAALLTSAIGTVVGGAVKAGATVAGTAATTAVAAATKTEGGDSAGPMAYFIDSMFRRQPVAAGTAPAAAGAPAADATASAGTPGAPAPATPSEPATIPATPGNTTTSTTSTTSTASAMPSVDAPPTGEVTRILMQAGMDKPLPPDDQRYLGQLVAERTGLSQADAEKRVADTVNAMQTKAREAEATAREAADKARKAGITATLWLFVSLLLGAFSASLAATWGGRQRDA
jgi:hypothetical protein